MRAILLLVFIINYCSGMDLPNKGESTKPYSQHIIFLNGTTTSGKSSIALELKKLLEARSLSVEILSIDSFIVPKVFYTLARERINPCNIFVPNENLLNNSHMKQMKDDAAIELCAAATVAYKQNNIVIIDAPVYEPKQIDWYKKMFEDLDVTWVLAYCPIKPLVLRVMARNRESSIIGQRSILQALHQYSCLYESRRNNVTDTLSQTKFDQACKLAKIEHEISQKTIPGFLKGVQKIICPFDFDTVQNMMLAHIAFDENNIAGIAPRKAHDYIINTNLYCSDGCARMILNFLIKNH